MIETKARLVSSQKGPLGTTCGQKGPEMLDTRGRQWVKILLTTLFYDLCLLATVKGKQPLNQMYLLKSEKEVLNIKLFLFF